MSINLAGKEHEGFWLFCVLLLRPEKKNQKLTGQIIFQANLPCAAYMCCS